MCSRDLKSKCAIRLGATKDTREIFSLSALFLCCLCEIQCAIMARTDPSFDMPLLEFSSDLSKRFLHCSCEQFICLSFFLPDSAACILPSIKATLYRDNAQLHWGIWTLRSRWWKCESISETCPWQEWTSWIVSRKRLKYRDCGENALKDRKSVV